MKHFFNHENAGSQLLTSSIHSDEEIKLVFKNKMVENS